MNTSTNRFVASLPDWARQHKAVVDLCMIYPDYDHRVRTAWTTQQHIELIETAKTMQPHFPGMIRDAEPPPLPLFA